MDDDLLFHNKFVSDLKVPSTYDVKNKNKEAAFREYIEKKKNIVGLNDEDTDIFEEHVMTTNPLVLSKDGSLNKERHVIERRYIYNINSKTRQITKDDYVEREVVTGEYVKVTTNNFGEIIYEPVDVDELNLEYNALDVPNSVVNPFFMIGENMYFKSFLYRTPDEYIIDLPLMHTNVKSVRLLSSVIPCTTTNINKYNNHVMIDILFGSTQVIENQDFDVVFGTYLMKIPYGNYTIDEVCSKITSLANAFYFANYTNNTGNDLYDKDNMLSNSSFKYSYSPITGELYFSLDQPSNLKTIETLAIVEPTVYENTIRYDPTGLNSNYNTVQIPLKEYTDFLNYIRTLVAAMNYDFCGYVLNSYINQFIVIEKENKRYLCSLFESFDLDMSDPTYKNIRQSLNLTSGINNTISNSGEHIIDVTGGYVAFAPYNATSTKVIFTVGTTQYSEDIVSDVYNDKDTFFDAVVSAMNTAYGSSNFGFDTLNNKITSNVQYTFNFSSMNASLSDTIVDSTSDITPVDTYDLSINTPFQSYDANKNKVIFTVGSTIYSEDIVSDNYTSADDFFSAVVSSMNTAYGSSNFGFDTLNNKITSSVQYTFNFSSMNDDLSNAIVGNTNDITPVDPYDLDINTSLVSYNATSTKVIFTVGSTEYSEDIVSDIYANKDTFFAAVVSAMNTAYGSSNFGFDTLNNKITSSVQYTFNFSSMNDDLSNAIVGSTSDITPVDTYDLSINTTFESYDATKNKVIFTVGSTIYSEDIVSDIYTNKDTFFTAILNVMNSKYSSGNFTLLTHTLNNGTTGYSIKSNVQYTFNTMNNVLSTTIFGTEQTNDITSVPYGIYMVDVTAGYNNFVNYNSTLANDIFFTVANTTYKTSIGNVFFTNYNTFITAIIDAMNDDVNGYPLGNFTFSTQQQLKFNNSNYNYELENRYYIMSDVYFNFECSTMGPLISSPLFGSVIIETTNENLYYVDISSTFTDYDATNNTTEILFTVAGTSYTGNIDAIGYINEDEFFAAVVSAMNTAYPEGNFAFLKHTLHDLTVEYIITSSVVYTFNVMESALSTAIFGTVQTSVISSTTYTSYYMMDVTAGYETPYYYNASLVSDEIVFDDNSNDYSAVIDNNTVYNSFVGFMEEIVSKMNSAQTALDFSFIVSRNGTTTKYYLASSGDFNIKVNTGETDIRLATKIFGVIPTRDFNSTVHSLEVTQPNSEFLYKPTATTEIHFNFNSTDFIAYIPSVNYPDYDTFITAIVNAMNVTCKNGFFAFDREGSEGYYKYTLYSAGDTTLKFSDMPAIGTVMVHPPTDTDKTASNFQIDLTGGYNAFIMPYDAYASDYSKLYLNIRQKVPDPPFEDDPAITNVTVQVPLVLNGNSANYTTIDTLMTHIISQINSTISGASWLKADTTLTFGYSINTTTNIITIFCESTPSDVYEFNLDGSLMVALASFLGIAITTPKTYTTSYVSPYNYGNRLRFKMSFENNPDVSQDDQLWYMLGFRSNNSLLYLDTPWTNIFDYGNDSYYFSSTSFVNNFVPSRSTEMIPDTEDKRPFRLPSMTKSNYVYLQLNNYENMYDPSIPNEKIYTKILLSEDYGKFAYDTFIDNPYVLSTTDSRLDRLQIKFIDKNANPVDFNNVDHTLTLEIVEYSDRLAANDYNTRRGYNEHSSYPEALRLGYGK